MMDVGKRERREMEVTERASRVQLHHRRDPPSCNRRHATNTAPIALKLRQEVAKKGSYLAMAKKRHLRSLRRAKNYSRELADNERV